MLEEIGNLAAFQENNAHARSVHGRILHAMREKTGGAYLVRPAATHFANSFVALKSLYKHKDALKALFYSENGMGINWQKPKLVQIHMPLCSLQSSVLKLNIDAAH
jgi:hypothetical protein